MLSISLVMIQKVILEKSKIYNELVLLRDTIESIPKDAFPSNTAFKMCLTQFPKGCCGDTARLVALHLSLKFGADCTYIAARGLGDNREESHAWLQHNDHVIDLTADQFNSRGFSLDKVVYSKTSEFHSLFNTYKLSEIDVKSVASTPVGKAYNLVKIYLNNG
jgi:hypothetical protein